MLPTNQRNYHPLIKVMYLSDMLPKECVKQLPRTTIYNWKNTKHTDYDYYPWAAAYLKQFDDIKEVYESKYTARAIKTMLKARRGFYTMLGEMVHHKSLLKQHSENIVAAIQAIASDTGTTVRQACKFYGVSKDWYYAQRLPINCTLSPIKKCYWQHPQQLSLKEITTIENLINLPQNIGEFFTTIYYQALRNNSIACSLTTFRKYAYALGYKKRKAKYKVRKKGLKATYVMEWLHVDITHVPTTNDGVQKVAFVKDNYSSAILHYATTPAKAGSAFIANLFQETFQKHSLHEYPKNINILSDGGPENKGELLNWVAQLKAPPIVKKITARTTECPFSNSMSESLHHLYKNNFMKGEISPDITSHIESLEKFKDYINNTWCPSKFYGKTPNEILNGEPIDKQLFSENIKKGKAIRKEENKKGKRCLVKIGCS